MKVFKENSLRLQCSLYLKQSNETSFWGEYSDIVREKLMSYRKMKTDENVNGRKKIVAVLAN